MADGFIVNMKIVNLVQSIYSPVLAVGDKILTLDQYGKVLYKIQLDAGVTCFDIQQEPSSAGFPLLIYGLKNGGIGAIELTTDEAVVLWESDFSFEAKAASSQIKVAQLQDNVNNIIVAREDGMIEVYTYTQSKEPVLVFEYREGNERITGITTGYVTSPKLPEILYSCYSGTIKSICDRK